MVCREEIAPARAKSVSPPPAARTKPAIATTTLERELAGHPVHEDGRHALASSSSASRMAIAGCTPNDAYAGTGDVPHGGVGNGVATANPVPIASGVQRAAALSQYRRRRRTVFSQQRILIDRPALLSIAIVRTLPLCRGERRIVSKAGPPIFYKPLAHRHVPRFGWK